MPIYRHSLKKQTRALAMIYGKKKKVPPIVEDQPTTNYGIKLCLQLWKTNPPQIMALSFVSNCGRPTTMGMDPNKRLVRIFWYLDISLSDGVGTIEQYEDLATREPIRKTFYIGNHHPIWLLCINLFNAFN